MPARLLALLLGGAFLAGTPVVHAQEPEDAAPLFAETPPAPDVEESPLPPLPPDLPETPVTRWAPPGPLTQRWMDSDDQTLMAVRGGFGVCTAATLPLQLVPQVGVVIAMGIEWGCILPTAVAVDYVQRAHGTRRSELWPALTSLVVAKVWRDLTRLPGLLNILALTTGITLASVGALLLGVVTVTVAVVAPFAPAAFFGGWLAVALGWAPVLVSGVLSYSALVFLVMELLRDSLGEFLFMAVFGMLSGSWPDAEAQWREQRRGWVRPRLNAAERTWLLASVAAGTSPAFRWWHVVPVVGPAVKAWDRHKALKLNLARMREDDFRQPPLDDELLNFTVITLCALEGAVGVLAHVATAISVGLFTLGFAAGAVQTVPRFQGPLSTAVALGAGGLATTAGVVALFLVVLRDVPAALKPAVIPLVFGLWPPLGFFPQRE